MTFTEVATIEKTFERAKVEGLGLSKTFFRRHCIDNSLHPTKAGSKFLIYWPNLLKLLENGQSAEPASEIRCRNKGKC